MYDHRLSDQTFRTKPKERRLHPGVPILADDFPVLVRLHMAKA
jgi:hypothetical protein